MSTLHVFDIDDTLFRPTADIIVRNKWGHFVTALSPKEFNQYRLNEGEKFDYINFTNAQKFQESEPIFPMIDRLRKVHGVVKSRPFSRVILNTARSDFDNSDIFLDKFRRYHIDIDDIYVERAGNYQDIDNPPQRKVLVIKQHLEGSRYNKVCMYDDHIGNLRALLDLDSQYPHVAFRAYHVQHDGSIRLYRETKYP